MIRPPPSSTLFPYTTLFRSSPTGTVTFNLFGPANGTCAGTPIFTSTKIGVPAQDRKSTRLNSSHSSISYAVFCLKKKTKREFPGHPVRRDATPNGAAAHLDD